jgi:uncharacterized protein (DUF2141 family)
MSRCRCIAPPLVAGVLALGFALGADARAIAQPAAPPARDARRPAPAGSSVIAGTVFADESPPRPLRRARVTIASSDWQLARTEISDDGGRFAFPALPAGRYRLSVVKAGYVGMAYGARRPNGTPTPIVLSDDQRVTNITIKLPRTSVVAGTVMDHNGEPYPGATVAVRRSRFGPSGQPRIEPGRAFVQTDDKGQFRAWGFGAGDYIVSAFPHMSGEIVRLTDADIASPSPKQDRLVGYAPAYYPGTFAPSQAIAVTVAAGEERSNVDLTLTLVHTAKVQGTVVVPDGGNLQTLSVTLLNPSLEFNAPTFQRSGESADGTFVFHGVPPGQYTVAVEARATSTGGSSATTSSPDTGPTHWAAADLMVDGEDLSGISLTLQPAFAVSGRLEFEGPRTRPDPTRVLVRLQPMQPEVSFGGPTVQADANGRFTVTGVVPGRYRLTAFVRGSAGGSSGWQIKTSTIGGRDSLDLPIELRASVASAVIAFTDRVAELSGVVLDAAGQPAPDFEVVAVAADRAFWGPESRRIRSVRPSADGKYLFENLPAGEYLVAAVADLEPGDLYGPSVLERLTRGAMKVSIAEGEKKTFDLRLAPQNP